MPQNNCIIPTLGKCFCNEPILHSIKKFPEFMIPPLHGTLLHMSSTCNTTYTRIFTELSQRLQEMILLKIFYGGEELEDLEYEAPFQW